MTIMRRIALPALALLASGCAVFSPIQTDQPAQVGDGVSADLGAVSVRDLVVVADSKEGPGTVSGQVVNNGDQPVTVTFALVQGGATATAEVGAHASLTLSADTPVTLSSLGVAPGGVADLAVSTPSGGAVPLTVPVVTRSGYYAGLK